MSIRSRWSCALMIVGVAAALGCGEARISGESDKAFERSLERVRDALPEAQRAEFSKAYAVFVMAQTVRVKSEAESGFVASRAWIRGQMADKNGIEVIAAARQICADPPEAEHDVGAQMLEAACAEL